MRSGFFLLVGCAVISVATADAQSTGASAVSDGPAISLTTRDAAYRKLLRELVDTGGPKVTKRNGWAANSFPTLPNDQPRILVPELFPTGEDGVPGWITRNEQQQLPAGPRISADNINLAARDYAQACADFRQSCDQARAFGSIVSALKVAANNHPDCDAAAKAYANNYANADPSGAVAIAYDAGCLGSLTPRYRGSDPVAGEALPAVFAGGADGNGALSAVAILVVDDQPFCGGLLRKDRTLVTARHCLDRYASAYTAKRVTVRSATGKQSWPVEPPSPPSVRTSPLVRDDWVVLKLGGTAPVAVADTTLSALDIAQPLTLVASFSRYRLMTYRDQADEWRHSLRFPRDGMCHGLAVQTGCLVLTCQTVPGFSGAPIFRLSGGSTPTVVGFVSGTLSSTTGCPIAGPYPTLAVSAEKIR